MADLNGLTPSPTELNQWNTSRAKTNLGFGQANATNAFQRGNLLANRSADFRGLKQQFLQGRNSLPGQYGARGLMNSGIYRQGLQDFNQQRTQAFGDLGRRYQQMLGQLDLQRQQGLENQFSALADINSAEAARRAELAAQIRGVY